MVHDPDNHRIMHAFRPEKTRRNFWGPTVGEGEGEAEGLIRRRTGEEEIADLYGR